ncbi:MAG: serine hydrolase domain-containing protein [Rhodanobacteraceae bacterium]
MLQHIAIAMLTAALCTPCVAAQQARPASSAAAVDASTAPVANGAATAGPPALDATDLRSFFGGLVPYMLKRNDIAGGVIAVVKDGHLIFSQGYGYANVAERTPVIADKTLFRIGSVSKLFTWTAVLQLVAEGKIDLNADVNRYLDFKIPPKYGKPITMRNLMTMTPGFAETVRDLITANDKQVPLREYVMNHIPPRIFPPGEVVAYSNYGATLAGYIVQRVSGEPFDRYVAQHILKPLQMDHSTFAQPLPVGLRRNMAGGYTTASNAKAMPFEIVQAAPAGSFTSTAADMANFMIMQSQNGQFNGASILPASIVQLMHSHQYSAAPGMNGYDLGFYQENRNGLNIIGHGGDTDFFHSDLHLLLDKGVGLFISFNSAGKPPNGTAESVRTSLFHAFLDRFYPYTVPRQPTAATAKRDAARVSGWYWASRRENSGLRVLWLLGQVHVAALPNGEITISMLKEPNGALTHWREIGPLTYRAVNGQSRVRFVTNPDGSIRWWVTDDFPPIEVFQPVGGLEQHGWFALLTPIALAVFVLTLLVWIIGAIARRRFNRKLGLALYQSHLRLASRIGVILLLAVTVGWLGLLAWFSQPTSLMHSGGLPAWLVVLFVLGVLGIIGAIATVGESVWRIARGPGGVLCRAGEALLALCAIYGIWVILAYGLANFNLHF